MNRALCSLSLLLSSLSLSAQSAQDWEIYYKETLFSFEQIDSLPVVEVRDTVYINFFMLSDSLRRQSDGFIVREFNVDDELVSRVLAIHEPKREVDRALRREILFRIDGSDRTTRFINDKAAIRRAISHIFCEMQNDSAGIGGINLYFPDYDFTHRRDMVQFVKSIRIMMDASRDFKFGATPLHVFFSADPDHERMHGDLIYSIGQETSSAIFIESVAQGKPYVRVREYSAADWNRPGFLLKVRSHLMIARYTTEDIDIRKLKITDFSETNIGKIIETDYPENQWETYVFILAVILLLLVGLAVLYKANAATSLFVSVHAESVLLALVVVILEAGVLLVTAFENMCGEDRLTIVERHPVVMFFLPLAVVLAAPLLHNILKNRKVP